MVAAFKLGIRLSAALISKKVGLVEALSPIATKDILPQCLKVISGLSARLKIARTVALQGMYHLHQRFSRLLQS